MAGLENALLYRRGRVDEAEFTLARGEAAQLDALVVSLPADLFGREFVIRPSRHVGCYRQRATGKGLAPLLRQAPPPAKFPSLRPQERRSVA